MLYSVEFCNRPEAAIDVISDLLVRLIVPDKDAKFGVPGLNLSREIRPKGVRYGIFRRFLNEWGALQNSVIRL